VIAFKSGFFTFQISMNMKMTLFHFTVKFSFCTAKELIDKDHMLHDIPFLVFSCCAHLKYKQRVESTHVLSAIEERSR